MLIIFVESYKQSFFHVLEVIRVEKVKCIPNSVYGKLSCRPYISESPKVRRSGAI